PLQSLYPYSSRKLALYGRKVPAKNVAIISRLPVIFWRHCDIPSRADLVWLFSRLHFVLGVDHASHATRRFLCIRFCFSCFSLSTARPDLRGPTLTCK